MKKVSKVFLIQPAPQFSKEVNEPTEYPPLGLAYIAAFLESKGVECEILDLNIFNLNNEKILKKIKAFNPDIVGISTNVSVVKEAVNISRYIKHNTKALVVLGGPYASSTRAYSLKESKADCIVRGESEKIFWNLTRHRRNFKKIKGISYLHKKGLNDNPPEELIKDIDKLPFPSYHLLPNLNLYKSRSRRNPVAPILTSRGCPYMCVYCNKNIFGNVFRPRSPMNVVEEIEFLIDKYKVKQIDVMDDNFTLDAKRAEEILDLIIKRKLKICITMPNGLRADRLNYSLVRKMKKAGVYKVGIGIETGDKKVMKNIKKGLDLEKVKQVIKWFRKEKITVFGFFMFGLPGDTTSSMKKTIDFAKEADPHIANFAITLPLPGTELYEIIKKRGNFNTNVKEGIESGYYAINKGYYDLDGLKGSTVVKYQRKAFISFYFRPKKIYEVITSIKSFNELKWTISTAWPILKSILLKPFSSKL